MATQNQEYGNYIASLEDSYANLQTQFKEAQVNTDQNFTTINSQLATINSKLAKLETTSLPRCQPCQQFLINSGAL
jgi:flagellar capping protein FliD